MEEAIALVFAACLTQWTANEAAALSGVDPEGVHEMRVALRRMRSGLSDFREIIPAAQVGWIKRETKWLIASLVTARDWDVFLSELLAPLEAARHGDIGLAELRKAAEVEREKGYAHVRSAIRSPRYITLVARMRQWLSTMGWRQGRNAARKSFDEPARILASRLLTKRHKAILKLGHGFKKLSPQGRHHLRIALKKLRYTVEFFRSLYHKQRERTYFHALAELQNSLGRMNDIVVADHLLESLTTTHKTRRLSNNLSKAVGMIAGWHTHSVSSSEHEAEANWREFCDCDTFWPTKR